MRQVGCPQWWGPASPAKCGQHPMSASVDPRSPHDKLPPTLPRTIIAPAPAPAQQVLEYLGSLGVREAVGAGQPLRLPPLAPHHWQQLNSAAAAARPQLDRYAGRWGPGELPTRVQAGVEGFKRRLRGCACALCPPSRGPPRSFDDWREEVGTLPDGRHVKVRATRQQPSAPLLLPCCSQGRRALLGPYAGKRPVGSYAPRHTPLSASRHSAPCTSLRCSPYPPTCHARPNQRYYAIDTPGRRERLMVVAEDGVRRDRRYAYKAAPDLGGCARLCQIRP